MDKLFEKIGDHFNNPEMSDRILVVKVRKDGWEKFEAALRVKNITKANSCDEETSVAVSRRLEEQSNTQVENDRITLDNEESPVMSSCCSAESSENCAGGSRTVSRQSCDSGISEDATCLETKRSTKCKRGEESEHHGLTHCDSKLVSDLSVSLTNNSADEALKGLAGDLLSNDTIAPGGESACMEVATESVANTSDDDSSLDETLVEMNISESLSEMFLLLIESLYKPDVVMNESVENLLVMMRLAHIYDAESTLKTCQKLLGSADLTVEICDRALNMQEHERLPEMAEFVSRCEEFLIEEFSPLDSQWSSEEFLSLSSNGLQKVLSSNDLCVSSENTVFLALMKWSEVNEVFDDQLDPLLELVRFKAMTINYLHDVVTSDHPIASTVTKFPQLFEEAVFYHAFSKERQCEEGMPVARKTYNEPVVFNWTVDIGEDIEVEKKKKIVKSPHFWVSGYEMFLELKLRVSGCQGLYLTISTRDFRHTSKGFVKLAYSLTSNFPKATRVINEADVFDREGSGWGYEEFFPLSWTEFKDQLKRTPLVITSRVSLLE
ncbi:Kelch-like protein 24 [Acropora cervicornis]|uniref:Kelch-like protein 24 n=1 Tax=Acropora cervicornis TaxID=6130 RepID=A0AAD9VFV9_ACRCE|nr:Kelch-like protein 24 [Acropora cervicornis]